MKNRQVRLIIGILVGLVLFSSSLAFLFYTKQDQVESQNKDNIEVYVASKKLAMGEMIGASDLQKTYLPKSYIVGAPLSEAEIIGRYASVDIFTNELFRKEKISLIEPKLVLSDTISDTKEEGIKEEALTQELSDTITLPLSLFQNIDTSLKKGDKIDIVSTIPDIQNANLNTREQEFKTKYIATKITIHSFVSNAHEVNTMTSVDSEQKLIYADSVVLEMSPKVIKNFFGAYYKTQELNANRVYNTTQTNKGHLWMVKCAKEDDSLYQNQKERLMVDYIVVQTKKAVQIAKKKAKEKVSISYEE